MRVYFCLYSHLTSFISIHIHFWPFPLHQIVKKECFINFIWNEARQIERIHFTIIIIEISFIFDASFIRQQHWDRSEPFGYSYITHTMLQDSFKFNKGLILSRNCWCHCCCEYYIHTHCVKNLPVAKKVVTHCMHKTHAIAHLPTFAHSFCHNLIAFVLKCLSLYVARSLWNGDSFIHSSTSTIMPRRKQRKLNHKQFKNAKWHFYREHRVAHTLHNKLDERNRLINLIFFPSAGMLIFDYCATPAFNEQTMN